MVSREDLDKRICDIYEEEDGIHTLREWIKECEEEYGLEEKDLDNIREDKLMEYIEWLEYLREK